MMDMSSRAALAERVLSYEGPGATRPAATQWRAPAGYRGYEKTVRIGAGDEHWRDVSAAVMAWGVKTRSGFTVEAAGPVGAAVHVGERYWILAHLGPVVVREPAQVVEVVNEADRCGFAYGTLQGHPVSGEEAFVVWRDASGEVFLTLRSLTRPGHGFWRLAFPGILIAQKLYRQRYLRALAR